LTAKFIVGSRHSTSLLNSQQFTMDEDGPPKRIVVRKNTPLSLRRTRKATLQIDSKVLEDSSLDILPEDCVAIEDSGDSPRHLSPKAPEDEPTWCQDEPSAYIEGDQVEQKVTDAIPTPTVPSVSLNAIEISHITLLQPNPTIVDVLRNWEEAGYALQKFILSLKTWLVSIGAITLA
jgi:hypothetical protein